MQAQERISLAPLDDEQRARGRRLAITSHPAGMTFRMVFTQHLPTLALVSLGAGEFWVGLQASFAFGFHCVNDLRIAQRRKRHNVQRLCYTSSKNARTMCSWQYANLR